MADPTEGLTKAMSDAFSVVEMSVEDHGTRSPSFHRGVAALPSAARFAI